jgi:hypothetical protein
MISMRAPTLLLPPVRKRPSPTMVSNFFTLATNCIHMCDLVATLFDFESAGEGAYTFEPLTSFVVEDDVAEIGFARQQAAEAPTVTINISGDLAKREAEVDKRAVVSCSSSTQASFISSSYSEAKSLASLSVSYISSRGTSDSLYRSYWGSNSASTISNVFSRVAAESGSRTLSCSDPYGVCTGGVIAYTLIATTNVSCLHRISGILISDQHQHRSTTAQSSTTKSPPPASAPALLSLPGTFVVVPPCTS